MSAKSHVSGIKFQVVSAFRGEPYYFNCRECDEPIFIEGDYYETEERRTLGYCATCRPGEPMPHWFELPALIEEEALA